MRWHTSCCSTAAPSYVTAARSNERRTRRLSTSSSFTHRKTFSEARPCACASDTNGACAAPRILTSRACGRCRAQILARGKRRQRVAVAVHDQRRLVDGGQPARRSASRNISRPAASAPASGFAARRRALSRNRDATCLRLRVAQRLQRQKALQRTRRNPSAGLAANARRTSALHAMRPVAALRKARRGRDQDQPR